MFITGHAAGRIGARLSDSDARDTFAMLESVAGEPGAVAYIVCNAPDYAGKPSTSEPGWWYTSNGDTIVALAREGSVETVFFRRSTQDMSPAFFGVRKVVDMRRPKPLRAGGDD